MRPNGVRATAQYSLHMPRWTSDGADLQQLRLTVISQTHQNPFGSGPPRQTSRQRKATMGCCALGGWSRSRRGERLAACGCRSPLNLHGTGRGPATIRIFTSLQ